MSSLRAKNRKPTHPGETLREDILPELGLTQGEFAKHLSRDKSGSSDWTRTSDPMINSHLLYRLSYRGTYESVTCILILD